MAERSRASSPGTTRARTRRPPPPATPIFLYAAALVSLRLNVAYPVLVSGSVVAVALLSLLLFDEPFYWTTVAGIVLVMVGVVLIAMRAG
jgi:multidrug transporter EmrE-like cation transporter